MTLVTSAGVGLLLVQLYQTSNAAQLGRAEAVAARACDLIRDRYDFYTAGSSTAPAPALASELIPVVIAALARQPGVEGGIWSVDRGAIAYAFPTGGGGVPEKTELPAISTVNQAAFEAGQAVQQEVSATTETLVLGACPLATDDGLTGWAMTRVQRAGAFDRLRVGLGLLGLLVLAIAGWATWLTAVWGRHVRAIEATLATHRLEDLPQLPPTGERELDRIVAALNDAGLRLAQARARTASLAASMASAERLAALGRVAAGVAHEIRNPMAAMRLRAENALAGDGTRDRPALEASLRQIARMDRMVEELLAMTQRRAPERVPTDVLPFLAQKAAEHADQAQAHGVRLDVAGSGAVASFDPELVGRALDNLLLNALRHTPAGGTVGLHADMHGTTLRLSVSDTGPGVDPAVRPRLFEPFNTGRPDGTGLGLAIAREMAEAHGGRLTLVDGAGPGAVFAMEIPAMESPCPRS